MLKRNLISGIFSLVLLFCITQSSNAQKTDTIFHTNGNILTGDLKKMIYGVATWKMDGMGSISLEQPEINSIKSDKLFEIKTNNGNFYFGSFDTSGIPQTVHILTTNGSSLISLEDIVEINPIKRSFWERINGSFSLGANFSKASNVGTIATAGNLDYRKKKSYYSISWDDNNTFQGDSISSTTADINLAWQRLLANRWSIGLAAGATQNTELGYKIKYDFNAVGIKDISYNDWNRFYVAAGLAVTRETPFDDSGITEDLTGIIQLVWKVFKYTSPKIWVDANIDFLPYITGGPRYRTVFNLNPQVSIFSNNFKVGVKFYYNHDSKPPSATASNLDYGVNLQLTYFLH